MELNRFWLLLLIGFFPACFIAGGDEVDLQMVHRIKAEAFGNSQVMDHLFYLTDVNGPRLTGSPGFDHAASWSLERIKSWGIANAHLEGWGPLGRGWQFSRFEMHMVKPTFAPLHAMPLAWCEGTKGPMRGQVVAAPFLGEDETPWTVDVDTVRERLTEFKAQWAGKLRGKIVLVDRLRDFKQPTEAPSHRLDDKQLSSTTESAELIPIPRIDWVPDRLSRSPKQKREFRSWWQNLPVDIQMEYWDRISKAFDQLGAFLREEGVLAAVRNDTRGLGGTVFAEEAVLPDDEGVKVRPTIKLASEQFNRLLRLTEKEIPVELELDLAVEFVDSPKTANVVAEIPGAKKPEEVVMFGGHLDSWHAGTGATDNAAGCAVVLEALRVLKALDVKMDRTVRLALWSGEEQGLHGSRAYVRAHFGDCVSMLPKSEHATFCGYFNVDNGSGKIRGIYLQDNDMMRPIFEAWLAPFKDLGVTTVSIRNTLYTDHQSFDAIGLPAFQFIQDPLDYDSRTHHSELDVYDHVEPGDLMQASAVLASFVYNAASREALLPRKPIPKALPERKTATASLQK